MADDEIRPASVVQIRQREAAADVLAAEVGTALQSNVAKLAVALVAQQNGALAQAGFGGKPNDVAVADHQILPTVVVQVEKAGAKAHVALADGRNAGRRGAEEKKSLALIAVQTMHLILVIGDPDGIPAAPIIVARVRPHTAIRIAPVIA